MCSQSSDLFHIISVTKTRSMFIAIHWGSIGYEEEIPSNLMELLSLITYSFVFNSKYSKMASLKELCLARAT